MKKVYLVTMTEKVWPTFYFLEKAVWEFVQKGIGDPQKIAEVLQVPKDDLQNFIDDVTRSDIPNDRMLAVSSHLCGVQGVKVLLDELKKHSYVIVEEDAHYVY